jgi:acyl-coenzyme A synthetase/AMP-(fatty) acid ligase
MSVVACARPHRQVRRCLSGLNQQEVEDILLAYPGVMDASVVGVPDETWGERVVAVVAGRTMWSLA